MYVAAGRSGIPAGYGVHRALGERWRSTRPGSGLVAAADATGEVARASVTRP